MLVVYSMLFASVVCALCQFMAKEKIVEMSARIAEMVEKKNS